MIAPFDFLRGLPWLTCSASSRKATCLKLSVGRSWCHGGISPAGAEVSKARAAYAAIKYQMLPRDPGRIF